MASIRAKLLSTTAIEKPLAMVKFWELFMIAGLNAGWNSNVSVQFLLNRPRGMFYSADFSPDGVASVTYVEGLTVHFPKIQKPRIQPT